MQFVFTKQKMDKTVSEGREDWLPPLLGDREDVDRADPLGVPRPGDGQGADPLGLPLPPVCWLNAGERLD